MPYSSTSPTAMYRFFPKPTPGGAPVASKPSQEARQGIQIELLAEDGEFHVFAQSLDRVTKERSMRRRQLKWLRKQGAANRTTPRGTLSAAHQSHRQRSRPALAVLYPARHRRRGPQEPQGRPRHSPDLPQGREADRSPRLHRLPGLLPAHHPDPPPASPRSRPDRAKRARKVRCID
jgi:hypothetical protein